MGDLKVMTLVGTRPELIKLSEVIKELDRATNHILVHTGQNYDFELSEVFFQQLGIRKPDYFLDAFRGTPAQTIADIIAKSDELMRDLAPDALLVYGDTNSCLCVISAKKLKIPIFHMEAGNRCFDQRVPEEINRKIVDHLSDINMPLSEHARGYLLSEGIKPETIIKIGSPMSEVLHCNMEQILLSKVLEDRGLVKDGYFLVSIHREENVDSENNFNNLLSAISELSERHGLPVIVSTHPRTRKRLDAVSFEEPKGVTFAKPFGFHEYVFLQMNARCVLSDSGTISEESSILNLPAVMIRQAHERPEAMDETVAIMSELDRNSVLRAVKLAVLHHDGENRAFAEVNDYRAANISKKVVRIITSYVGYVNRTVWHREA